MEELETPAVEASTELGRVQGGLARVTQQVDDLRNALNTEVQALRQGLATVAEAVRAVRPVLDLEVERRAASEARLLERLDRGLQEVRAEAVRARSRLAALERQADESRRELASAAVGAAPAASDSTTAAEEEPEGEYGGEATSTEAILHTMSAHCCGDRLPAGTLGKSARPEVCWRCSAALPLGTEAGECTSCRHLGEVEQNWERIWSAETQEMRQLGCALRAEVKAATAAAEGATTVGMRLAAAHNHVRTEVSGLSHRLSESEVALGNNLGQQFAATLEELRTQQAQMLAERRRFAAGEAEVLKRSERWVSAECSEVRAREGPIEQLAEAAVTCAERCQREERGLAAKVQELSGTMRRQLAAERSEVLEAAERSVGRRMEAGLANWREELRRHVYQRLLGHSRTWREELQKELRAHTEEQAARMQEVLGVGRLSSAQAEAEVHHAVDEVREELKAFMDEQRLFCGFLDTEQTSYQELVRQQIDALSRLVDSSLRGSSNSSSGVRAGQLRQLLTDSEQLEDRPPTRSQGDANRCTT